MVQQLQDARHAVHDKGDVSEDASEDDDLPDLVKLRHALDSVRYSVPRKNVVRSTTHQRLLHTLEDAEFRTFTCVSKNTFNVLLDLIRDDVVFQPKPNSTKRPQLDVFIQLAVTLEWYGAYGNGNAVAHFVRNYGIGAGTVSTYVRRVQKALLRYYTSSVVWTSRFGLVEGVVGFVDGTHVILDQKPHINGALHYHRKCRYSLIVQIVCNEDKVILHAFTGWLGSSCDSTVFSKTPLAQHPERFFSDDQYLIGDTGYALSTHLITPYKLPAALKAENAFYNGVISSARVIIENCGGLYNNRWMLLKGIRAQVNRKKYFRHVNNYILVCAMLHNIGVALFNEWGDAALDDEDGDDTDINSTSHSKTEKEKREHIKTALLRS
ncbi:hypothetical protein PHPALM_29222 [Phytophthora palmivora]|uniref:DDE Tnp4 domain-containing protein n=1 Tax=Phytophthora palmivora TaxID=4796 RepID=A0A2P4X858_9STRA|nr:hypothetical protein PHPALM_29222 [Phytophthora palmivora]